MQGKRICGFLFAVFAALSFFGCMEPGKYGRLGIAEPDMTIEQLVKHWQDYRVSYAGVNRTQPTALLFDPKGDDRVLTLHRFWGSVNSQDELSEVIQWMRPSSTRVVLYKIMGPGNQVFGYLYTFITPPTIKVVDDKTLWVGNMTLRDFEGAAQN